MPTATSLIPDRPLARRAGVTVARALGSSTRASIYDHLREVGADLTVRDVAATFELHPNVARTHLELLADAGLVAVGRRKHPGGGRPAKVYAARDDAEVAATQADAAQVARAGEAPALLVRLLIGLLEDPAVRTRLDAAPRPGLALAARAHEAAAAEGRRLVAGLAAAGADEHDQDGDAGPRSALTRAAQMALRAVRVHAPEARVVRGDADWVEIGGVGGLFALAARVRPELAEAMERGLVAGAFAAAGVPVSLEDAGSAPAGGLVGGPAAGEAAGRLWRARPLAAASGRAVADPSGTVDARGQQREAGVVSAMRAVTALRPGEVLEVLAEGPGSPAAFARWADRAGHQLLGVERAVDAAGRPAIRLLIRKGA